MAERPYTVLSCGISIDGYLDDGSASRLVLSNPADLDRVDAERAGCDAILVGAATIRSDNPRLLVRSPARRAERISRGLPPSPMKVTLTAGGDLDPGAQFFTTGTGEKLVYTAGSAVPLARTRLAAVATVVDAGDGAGTIDLAGVGADLRSRGRALDGGRRRTHPHPVPDR